MKQIVVHCEESLTEVALLEDRRLVEYYVERQDARRLAGNIYKARVVNVLPGMQAAFVDIGKGKNAFLYIDDLLHAHLDKQPKVKPAISELVHEGQELVVQVTKEPSGTKGARVTTHFSLPGRWLVYMPFADYVGVSRKIGSEAERSRLKHIGEEIRQNEEGIIIRTVADGESLETLQKDLQLLRNLWSGILQRNEQSPVPSELYCELDIVPRLVRDVFTEQIDQMQIDHSQKGEEVIRFLQDMAPKLAERVTIMESPETLLASRSIHECLDKLYQRKVWLDCGGYVVVDHTEALTVFDVNTGKYVGSESLEDTVYRTNLEAARLIARLIRLKDIGGMILIDFIDMVQEEHNKSIMQALEDEMKKDRTKYNIVGWTKLGLLEMTRKKVREHLSPASFETCQACKGTGKIYIRHKK